jgi:hypothetical protein
MMMVLDSRFTTTTKIAAAATIVEDFEETTVDDAKIDAYN